SEVGRGARLRGDAAHAVRRPAGPTRDHPPLGVARRPPGRRQRGPGLPPPSRVDRRPPDPRPRARAPRLLVGKAGGRSVNVVLTVAMAVAAVGFAVLTLAPVLIDCLNQDKAPEKAPPPPEPTRPDPSISEKRGATDPPGR